MTRVLVFGTFDGLHPGHEFFLKEAASFGGEIWAIVPPDEVVERLKGHPPKEPARRRMEKIMATGLVHQAVLGDTEEGKYEVVKKVSPELIFLGYDQEALFEDICRAISHDQLPAIKIERGSPHHPEEYHSSLRN